MAAKVDGKGRARVTREVAAPASVVWATLSDGWLYASWVVGASRGSKRVEGTEHVAEETRRRHLGAVDRTPGVVGRLEDHDVPAGIGQHVGSDKPVRPGADDHCVHALTSHGSLSSGSDNTCPNPLSQTKEATRRSM